MADVVVDGPEMIGQLFGKGQRLPHQTGDALPQGVIETLDVVSFPKRLLLGQVVPHVAAQSLPWVIGTSPFPINAGWTNRLSRGWCA